MLKNKNRIKSVRKSLSLWLLCVVILLTMFSTSVFAENMKFRLNDRGDDRSDATKFSTVIAQDKYNITVKDIGAFNESQGELDGMAGEDIEDGLFLGDNESGYYFNTVVFETLPSKEQREVLKSFISDCTHIKISTEGSDMVFNNIESNCKTAYAVILPLVTEESSANLLGALKVVKPFFSPVGIALGIASIMLILAIVVTTVIDMLFLGAPAVQNVGLQKGEEKGSRPKWITSEAWSALKQSEESANDGSKFKNASGIYLRLRAFTYLIFILCIFYLVAGQIVGLIAWFIKLVSGFGMN